MERNESEEFYLNIPYWKQVLFPIQEIRFGMPRYEIERSRMFGPRNTYVVRTGFEERGVITLGDLRREFYDGDLPHVELIEKPCRPEWRKKEDWVEIGKTPMDEFILGMDRIGKSHLKVFMAMLHHRKFFSQKE